MKVWISETDNDSLQNSWDSFAVSTSFVFARKACEYHWLENNTTPGRHVALPSSSLWLPTKHATVPSFKTKIGKCTYLVWETDLVGYAEMSTT